MNAVTIKHLSYSYEQGHKVIDDVSLEIKKGSYVSLLGHNGSGKSTLAKLMVGLLPADDGAVIISGLELNEKNLTAIRNKAAIVFQNPDNQFIGITVEDDIAFSLENRNIDREEMKRLVLEYAEKVGMKEFLNKEPAYLSGGQKQRVAIARALVLDPDFLLCDEATSALDPEITKGILALLQKINKEMGITIVVVTHQMEVVKQICQKVAFLSKGNVLAVGKPEQLFVWPKEKEIRDFLREESDKLPATGVNLKLFFYGEGNQRPIVTQMSQQLHTDFNICWAKLEDFREDVYGSLVLNMEEKDLEKACAFLDSKDVTWEVIK